MGGSGAFYKIILKVKDSMFYYAQKGPLAKILHQKCILKVINSATYKEVEIKRDFFHFELL